MGVGADLQDGLLKVSLVKEIPEAMKPKSIAINSGSKEAPKAQVLAHDGKAA